MRYYSEETVRDIINVVAHTALEQSENYADAILQNQPSIEIKEPHGDLIDKQAVVKQLSKAWAVECDSDFANKSVWRIIEKEAPTIIEASTKERE